jgi:hypothetical protein
VLGGRPRSRGEAAVVAAAVVQEALGRPGSRTEIVWWVDAHHANEPLARFVDPSKLAVDLRLATRQRTYRGRGDTPTSNAVLVRSDLTCAGGPALRFAVAATADLRNAPLAAVMVHACLLEDVLYAYRPHMELRSIAALEREADMLGVPLLRTVAAQRRAMLERAVGRTVLPEMDAEEQQLAVERAQHALQTLEVWIDLSRGITADSRRARRRLAAERRRGLTALARLLGAPTPGGIDASARTVQIVGEAAVLSLRELASLGAAARAEDVPTGGGGRGMPTALEGARRFPPLGEKPLGWQADAWLGGGRGDLAVVDRVDALLAIYDAMGLPVASALLGDASALLGHVIRDADFVREVLAALPAGEAPVRRAAVVALGLLGTLPPLAEAVTDLRSSHDLEAYVFACALAGPTDVAARRISDAYTAASGDAAREVADLALARLEGGDRFGVVG